MGSCQLLLPSVTAKTASRGKPLYLSRLSLRWMCQLRWGFWGDRQGSERKALVLCHDSGCNLVKACKELSVVGP